MLGCWRTPKTEEERLDGLGTSGGVLAGAKEEAFAGTRVDSTAEPSEPLFRGSIVEFGESKSNDLAFQRQLKNTIKKCKACGKVCAFSMINCNECGTPLLDEVTFSPNIFMGFIYGVQKGPFPFTISIRLQTEDMLAFDDLLALTPAHLNIIPTNAYIPDWRFLLTRPLDGLRLLTRLEDAAWDCVATQFIKEANWRQKYLKGGHKKLTKKSLANLRQHVICGCNFPPSQFHLHIQYMMMPLIPWQYHMYQNGAHYTAKRFFPLDYIKAVLALGESMDITMETKVDDIINHFESRVSYEAMHKDCYERVERSHQLLANWKAGDFETVIEGDSVVGSERPKAEQVATDKAILQNYGRPYNDQGKPSGTYYKYARKERVPEWQDMDSRSFSQAGLGSFAELQRRPTATGRVSAILGRSSLGEANAISRLWKFVATAVSDGQVASLRESGAPSKVRV